MATPASQLGITSQPSSQCAAAAQPTNGNAKLASPTETASFHLARKTTGSSSAPARNVSTMAPMPARNLTQDSSVPSTAEPIAAPMMSCAIVPTTISDSAVETRNQIDSRLATSASPTHKAANAQTLVIAHLPFRRHAAAGARHRRASAQSRPGGSGSAEASSYRRQAPVGVISLIGGYRGTPSRAQISRAVPVCKRKDSWDDG